MEAPPERETLNGLIEMFQRRAKWRMWESYAVLLLMVLLLGAAGFVFKSARDITAAETAPDMTLQGLRDKRDVVGSQITSLAEPLISRLRKLGDVRQVDASEPPAKFRLQVLDESGKLRSQADVESEIGLDLRRTGNADIDYGLSLGGTSYPGIRLRVSASQLAAAAKAQAWAPLDFSPHLQPLVRLFHEASLDDSAILMFADRQQPKVEVPTGASEAQSNSNLSLPFLVQLNITRYGTLSLVAIAIGLQPRFTVSAPAFPRTIKEGPTPCACTKRRSAR